MRVSLCGAILGAVAVLAACSTRGGVPVAIPYAAAGLGVAQTAGLDTRIKVVGSGNDAILDRLVVTFMLDANVPNAQLAVSSRGAMIFSHAYTYRSLAASTATTATIMRLASNTKAWTSAALYNLVARGAVDPKAKVFAYLGITQPLPAGAKVDPRVYDITIENMIQHESGWDDSKPPYYDPSFAMRQTALKLGLAHAIDQTQYVRFQLHQPLQENPGTHFAYCNFCYDVLGMVVAKAAGTSYIAYLQKAVAAPSGAGAVAISPTVGSRVSGEIANYYNSRKGLSAVYVTSTKLWPYPYGGDGGVNEVAQGDGGVAASAQSMLALMNHYIIWGVGTPPPAGYGWARSGEMPGTETFAEQLPNRVNYAFDVNSNQFAYGSRPNAFAALQRSIEQHLCKRAKNCGVYL